MTPNNNLSVLPFYEDISKQNHRKDYAFGNVFALICDKWTLLPFQIVRPTSSSTIDTVALVELSTGNMIDITEIMSNAGLKIKRFASRGYDLIVFPATNNLTIAGMTAGQYYLKIGTPEGEFFSEVFTAVNGINPSEFLKITYYDDANFEYTGGHIDYTGGFKNFIYLPTQLGRPEYNFDEDVDKRDGYTFIEKQISEKVFKFNFVAPEFLCDAMRIIRMHDHIEIENKDDSYDADSFLITPKWLDQGYLASVDAEFECNTVIKKIGKAISPTTQGDFNDDFNNDYKK